MATVVDFLDQSTGTWANAAQIQGALTSGNWGGLTAVDADGNSQPAGSPLSPELQTGLPARLAGTALSRGGDGTQAAVAPNYVLWAAVAFAVWYFLLRKK